MIFKTQEKSTVEVIKLSLLLPHEEVIIKRKNTLLKYLESGEDIIIPSIICCKDTLMIIDGHHRYFSLLDLGIEQAPITLIDYNSELIRTHEINEKKIEKVKLIEAAQKGNKLLPPKSSKHQIKDTNGKWRPIILVSDLIQIR